MASLNRADRPSPIQTSDGGDDRDAELFSGPETAESMASGPHSMKSGISSTKTPPSAKSSTSSASRSFPLPSTPGSGPGSAMSGSPRASNGSTGSGGGDGSDSADVNSCTIATDAAPAAAQARTSSKSPSIPAVKANDQSKPWGEGKEQEPGPDPAPADGMEEAFSLQDALSGALSARRAQAPPPPSGPLRRVVQETTTGPARAGVSSVEVKGPVAARVHNVVQGGPTSQRTAGQEESGSEEPEFRKRVALELREMLSDNGGSCKMSEVAHFFRRKYGRLFNLRGYKLRPLLVSGGGLPGLGVKGSIADARLYAKKPGEGAVDESSAAGPEQHDDDDELASCHATRSVGGSGLKDKTNLRLTRTFINRTALGEDADSASPPANASRRRLDDAVARQDAPDEDVTTSSQRDGHSSGAYESRYGKPFKAEAASSSTPLSSVTNSTYRKNPRSNNTKDAVGSSGREAGNKRHRDDSPFDDFSSRRSNSKDRGTEDSSRRAGGDHGNGNGRSRRSRSRDRGRRHSRSRSRSGGRFPTDRTVSSRDKQRSARDREGRRSGNTRSSRSRDRDSTRPQGRRSPYRHTSSHGQPLRRPSPSRRTERLESDTRAADRQRRSPERQRRSSSRPSAGIDRRRREQPSFRGSPIRSRDSPRRRRRSRSRSRGPSPDRKPSQRFSERALGVRSSRDRGDLGTGRHESRRPQSEHDSRSPSRAFVRKERLEHEGPRREPPSQMSSLRGGRSGERDPSHGEASVGHYPRQENSPTMQPRYGHGPPLQLPPPSSNYDDGALTAKQVAHMMLNPRPYRGARQASRREPGVRRAGSMTDSMADSLTDDVNLNGDSGVSVSGRGDGRASPRVGSFDANGRAGHAGGPAHMVGSLKPIKHRLSETEAGGGSEPLHGRVAVDGYRRNGGPGLASSGAAPPHPTVAQRGNTDIFPANNGVRTQGETTPVNAEHGGVRGGVELPDMPAPALLPPPASVQPLSLPPGHAQGARLMIQGTHPAVPERRIHALVSGFGVVGKIEVLEGFVFVHMRSLDEAARAVAGLDGRVVQVVAKDANIPLRAAVWREEIYQALMARDNMRRYADSVRKASTWFEKHKDSVFRPGDDIRCRFYAMGRGCIFGHSCVFRHEQPLPNGAPGGPGNNYNGRALDDTDATATAVPAVAGGLRHIHGGRVLNNTAPAAAVGGPGNMHSGRPSDNVAGPVSRGPPMGQGIPPLRHMGANQPPPPPHTDTSRAPGGEGGPGDGIGDTNAARTSYSGRQRIAVRDSSNHSPTLTFLDRENHLARLDVARDREPDRRMQPGGPRPLEGARVFDGVDSIRSEPSRVGQRLNRQSPSRGIDGADDSVKLSSRREEHLRMRSKQADFVTRRGSGGRETPAAAATGTTTGRDYRPTRSGPMSQGGRIHDSDVYHDHRSSSVGSHHRGGGRAVRSVSRARSRSRDDRKAQEERHDDRAHPRDTGGKRRASRSPGEGRRRVRGRNDSRSVSRDRVDRRGRSDTGRDGGGGDTRRPSYDRKSRRTSSRSHSRRSHSRNYWGAGSRRDGSSYDGRLDSDGGGRGSVIVRGSARGVDSRDRGRDVDDDRQSPDYSRGRTSYRNRSDVDDHDVIARDSRRDRSREDYRVGDRDWGNSNRSAGRGGNGASAGRSRRDEFEEEQVVGFFTGRRAESNRNRDSDGDWAPRRGNGNSNVLGNTQYYDHDGLEDSPQDGTIGGASRDLDEQLMNDEMSAPADAPARPVKTTFTVTARAMSRPPSAAAVSPAIPQTTFMVTMPGDLDRALGSRAAQVRMGTGELPPETKNAGRRTVALIDQADVDGDGQKNGIPRSKVWRAGKGKRARPDLQDE